MKASIRVKLEQLQERFEELAGLLSDPEVIGNQSRFTALSKEYAKLEPVVDEFRRYRSMEATLAAAEEMCRDEDPDIRSMAEDEIQNVQAQLEEQQRQLQLLLLPSDPNDERNIFLEIRAGTGGDEAALFAGDLFRMYSRYAELRGWQIELISESPGEHGGFKEVIARVIGHGAYSRLKFESGAHRVQRVPVTESQGRIHTSACTVAILPEADTIDAIDINPADLKIDTFRASGAGGQHVNKTESAVRITHLPTGIVVTCQTERSQHANREAAMKILRARLLARKLEERRQKLDELRGEQGEIAWGNQIRSYVFAPYTLVKDHRTEAETGNVQAVMDGDLDLFIQSYLRARGRT